MLPWAYANMVSYISWGLCWLFLSCDSCVMKTASCPVSCRQRCSRSWRTGKTSWTTWMETRAKVCKWNRQHLVGQLGCVCCVYPKCILSRSAGWPELAGVWGFREVLCGTGGPLSPPHGGVIQWKQRAPTRQFPQIPPIPWRPAVPAAFHGNSDVCWIHSGQGAVQGRCTRSAAHSLRFYNCFSFHSGTSYYTGQWGLFSCRFYQTHSNMSICKTYQKCVQIICVHANLECN